MNIYRLSQTENHGQYDRAYHSHILVIAKSADDARCMYPDIDYINARKMQELDPEQRGTYDLDKLMQLYTWASSPDNVKVEYLGPVKSKDPQYAAPQILMADRIVPFDPNAHKPVWML